LQLILATFSGQFFPLFIYWALRNFDCYKHVFVFLKRLWILWTFYDQNSTKWQSLNVEHFQKFHQKRAFTAFMSSHYRRMFAIFERKSCPSLCPVNKDIDLRARVICDINYFILWCTINISIVNIMYDIFSNKQIGDTFSFKQNCNPVHERGYSLLKTFFAYVEGIL